jgi:Leucine-rich repeat (LRR) protein
MKIEINKADAARWALLVVFCALNSSCYEVYDSDKDTLFQCENVIVFPDMGLETAVRTAIAKPEGDIYLIDVGGLTSLNASAYNVFDLTGIHCLTGLNVLNLAYNSISDISALFALSNLTQLDLSYNRIVDLSPLANNAGLGNLDWVNLKGNSFYCSDSAAYDDITALVNRGVTVENSCDW